MYAIALTTQACLRANTEVNLAWAVETAGFSSRDQSEALALTPGGGRTGGVLSGAANDQIAELARTVGQGRLVAIEVNEFEAAVVGLSCGGSAQCVVMPASRLPAALWDHLIDREPVCLVTTRQGSDLGETKLFTVENIASADETTQRLFAGNQSQSLLAEDQIISVFHPVPSLVLVGGGVIVDALAQLAGYLGWQVNRTTQPNAAVAAIVGLSRLDKVVITSHDVDVAGPVLKAALASKVGYVGALGSRRTQAERHDWLARNGVSDVSAIHGPAGLNIGAKTPQEIAVSIVAEALSIASGTAGGSLVPGK